MLVHVAANHEEVKAAMKKGIPFAQTVCGHVVSRKSLALAEVEVTCGPCRESIRPSAPKAQPALQASVTPPPAANVTTSNLPEEDVGEEMPSLDAIDGLDVDGELSALEESVEAPEEVSKEEPTNGKHDNGGGGDTLSMVTMALEQIVPEGYVPDPDWQMKVEFSSLSAEDKKMIRGMFELASMAKMFKLDKLGGTLLVITARFAEMAIREPVGFSEEAAPKEDAPLKITEVLVVPETEVAVPVPAEPELKEETKSVEEGQGEGSSEG